MSDDANTTVVQPLDGGGDLTVTRRNLFLVGFCVLFMELACIRWFGAYVVFLHYFTNIILIACFVGMSIGCVCATRKTDWLERFAWITLIAVGLAIGLNQIHIRNSGLVIDVGGQRESPQVVFFGTGTYDVDLAKFYIPIEAVAGLFFVLITLMFIGMGQVLGRCFDRDPNRVVAYTLNIAGSLAGIAAFSLVSFVGAPPVVWFAIGFAGIGCLLKQAGKLKAPQIILLATTALFIFGAGISTMRDYRFYWSPYYWIVYHHQTRHIAVNWVSHQGMVPNDSHKLGSVYSLIHLLARDAGRPPFEDVLVIGAGSGNDVARSLRHGAEHIDAVEIDPVIQRLGFQHHPDHPYDDPRVQVHLDDGRNFLRRTDRKYDLVTYALVDSLILHSSYSSIRLESFLFTEQSFRDVQKTLQPDGVFVTYNLFRQGWVVQRIARMLEDTFGRPPIVISLPYVETIDPEAGLETFPMTMIIAGNTAPIAAAFQKHAAFWLNRNVTQNDDVNAFGERPPATGGDAEQGQWNKVAPASLLETGETLELPTDDWPFLYLRSPSVPWLYLRGAVLLAALGLGMLYWQAPGHRLAMNGRMFFLGAAFLLLETKAVVHLALVFGSTWVVNSLVFAAILVMILGANLYVLKAADIRLVRHYLLLFITLGLNAVVPLDIFLGGGVLWTHVAPCVLVMIPMFHAGVIFAVSFRDSRHPDLDFGANVAGAVIGGFTEYLSMLLGFRYLLLVAMAFYALSAAFGRAGAMPNQGAMPKRSTGMFQ